MKTQFPKVMREIKRTLNQLFIFEIFINTLVVFLFAYLILLTINGKTLLAIYPTAIFFVVSAYLRLTSNKTRIVEDKHASLREKLRTAADNMAVDSPIVDELEYEVMKEMKNVGLSEFFNAKNISFKILLTAILSFAIIFTSTLNVQFFDVTSLSLFPDEDAQDQQRSKGAGDFEAVTLKSDEDIYGDDRVAILGDDELNIRLKPVDFKISVKDEGELRTGTFNDIFPKNSFLKEGQEVQEDIPKEQQQLVKNYFKNLAES